MLNARRCIGGESDTNPVYNPTRRMVGVGLVKVLVGVADMQGDSRPSRFKVMSFTFWLGS